MLTYRLQARRFRLTGTEPLAFPNRATIRLTCESGRIFGVGNAPGYMIIPGVAATFVFDANSGRTTILTSLATGV